MLSVRTSHRFVRRSRQGAVAVEFAITAGLAFFFFFAALEFCRVSMIRHTVENALYEGARAGIVPGATASQVEDRARAILATIALRNVNVTVSPNPIRSDSATVEVRISLPIDRNLFAPASFFRGKRLDRTFTMQREGV